MPHEAMRQNVPRSASDGTSQAKWPRKMHTAPAGHGQCGYPEQCRPHGQPRHGAPDWMRRPYTALRHDDTARFSA